MADVTFTFSPTDVCVCVVKVALPELKMSLIEQRTHVKFCILFEKSPS